MIADRNIDKIGLDVALGAKAMLRDLQIEQVRVKSAGAATFYVWVCIQLLHYKTSRQYKSLCFSHVTISALVNVQFG